MIIILFKYELFYMLYSMVLLNEIMLVKCEKNSMIEDKKLIVLG